MNLRNFFQENRKMQEKFSPKNKKDQTEARKRDIFTSKTAIFFVQSWFLAFIE